ncbi:hypothetical protein GCM10022291_01930 [Postechiella marina]|uniref:Lipocalin-like domain-containing protein n=1 Tax=Postechiella marina TaxID=943941 RepID=A0ABP8BZ50_9FLAO
MKKQIFLITIFSVILGLTSCSSDDSSGLDANTAITSKTWLVQSKKLSPSIEMNGLVIDDIMIIEDEGTRNYSFKFDSDGAMYQYDAENTLIYQTTWSLNSDNTELSFGEPIVYNYPVVGPMGISAIDIESISNSKMVGTISAVFEGTAYVVTITFI